MIVRINYTTEVSDEFRAKINKYYGKEGLATREDIREFFYMHGQCMNDDINDISLDKSTEEV